MWKNNRRALCVRVKVLWLFFSRVVVLTPKQAAFILAIRPRRRVPVVNQHLQSVIVEIQDFSRACEQIIGGHWLVVWLAWIYPPTHPPTNPPLSLIYGHIVSAAPVHNSSDLSLPWPLTEAKGQPCFFFLFSFPIVRSNIQLRGLCPSLRGLHSQSTMWVWHPLFPGGISGLARCC